MLPIRRSLHAGIVPGLFAILFTFGCADDRPIYNAPAISKETTSTLVGTWGTYIDEIDGAHVASASFQFQDFGSNTVVVSAGKHHLTIHQFRGWGGGTAEVTTWFTFRCDAGHTYEICRTSIFNLDDLKITDKNTSQTLTIHPKRIRGNDRATILGLDLRF